MAGYTDINDPSEHFQVKTYTASGGSSHAIVCDGNSDMGTDWFWAKKISGGGDWMGADTNRGTGTINYWGGSRGISTGSAYMTSFDSDGVTTGESGLANDNGDDFVSYHWHCNDGTTTSNSDGNVTANVQVNSDIGFSIIGPFTSVASGDTNVGHGLGVKPDLFFVRSGATTSGFFNNLGSYVYGINYYMYMDYNSAIGGLAPFHADTDTIDIRTHDFLGNSQSGCMAYAFVEKPGFSRFGSFKGTGDVNGPFVYTGFKPAMIILKSVNSGQSVATYDHKRPGFNDSFPFLRHNDNGGENAGTISGDDIEFYANGFKLINSDNTLNQYNTNFVFMAFASLPFVGSGGACAPAGIPGYVGHGT